MNINHNNFKILLVSILAYNILSNFLYIFLSRSLLFVPVVEFFFFFLFFFYNFYIFNYLKNYKCSKNFP